MPKTKDEDEQKTKEEQKENEDAQDAKDEPKDEDEQKTQEEEKDEDVQGIKEEPEETHKVHIKQEPVDPSYFSKPVNLRSDTSEDASDPASAAPAAADAVDTVEKLSDPTAFPAANVVDETKVLVPLPASSPDVVDPMDEIPDQYDIEAYRTLSQELADAMDIDDN